MLHGLILGGLCVAVTVAAIVGGVSLKKYFSAADHPHKEAQDDDFSQCSVFLAPSLDFGWGVYAARNFTKAELIEIIPAFLPLVADGVEIQSSILYDYVHVRGCGPNSMILSDDEGDEEHADQDQLLLGCGSSYNHDEHPNIQFVEFGLPGRTGHITAVQALRDIAIGEELLARYGEDEWFESRKIPQRKRRPGSNPTGIPAMDVPQYISQYCSKVQAGMGSTTWNEKILPYVTVKNFWFEADRRLAPKDTGFGVARAKVALAVGDRIELSLGLLVSQRIMADTIIAPLLFGWNDLNTEQQRTMRMLRKNFRSQFVLHYPGQSDRNDNFESFEDLAILPIGTLALVRRLGGSHIGTANCRLNIRQYMQSGSTSVGLELIAITKIKQGEVLLLDVPPAGTPKERDLLENELKRTGQPYHSSTFAASKGRDEL